jgi:hypothetical protein
MCTRAWIHQATGFEQVQKVSQFCRIEKYSIVQSSGQSKIRRPAIAAQRVLPALPRASLFGATSVNNAYFSNISRATVARYFIPVSPRNLPAFVLPNNKEAETCPN